MAAPVDYISSKTAILLLTVFNYYCNHCMADSIVSAARACAFLVSEQSVVCEDGTLRHIMYCYWPAIRCHCVRAQTVNVCHIYGGVSASCVGSRLWSVLAFGTDFIRIRALHFLN